MLFEQRAIMSIVVAAGILAAGVRAYERSTSSPVTIAVVASLAALASAGRVAFASIPNVQPTTFIVATTGVVLGPSQGFMVGVLSALASNVFLGHGPWTVWQMAAWGAVGASAGLLGVIVPGANHKHLAVFSGLWGFLFGLIMNAWYWLSFTFPLSLKTLVIVEAAGIWFDIMHSAGNVAFALVFGDQMLRILRRFSRRLTHFAKALLLIAALMTSGGLPAAAAPSLSTGEVESAIARGIVYLRSCQNDDGGFPLSPGGESCEMATSWAVMALKAVGLDPNSGDWRKKGGGPGGVLLSVEGFHDHRPASSTDIARRILALRALGVDRHKPDIDRLAGALASRQGNNGDFAGENEEGLLNAQFWSIIALAHESRAIVDRDAALESLLAAANSDGGFGYARGLPSDPDDTAAAIQAMIALGERGERLARSVRYLAGTVSRDGGVVWQGGRPNVASAAWVAQALSAALPYSPGEIAAPLAALKSWMRSLQTPGGSFMYMEGVSSMPVWMTTQAILGLSGLPFPRAVGFSDLPPSHWAAQQVNRLARSGAVKGYPDGGFRPSDWMTRAEIASLVDNIINAREAEVAREADGASSQPAFRDVPRSHWAFAPIARVSGLGIIKGLARDTFGPEAQVTGGHVAALACRLAGIPEPAAYPGEAWYGPFISAASAACLLYPGFDARLPAPRAGCAYALARADEMMRERR